MTASVGRAPVTSASAATPVLTSASTLAATALPSRSSTAAAGSGGDGDAQPLDGQPPARVGIDANQSAVERDRTLGRLDLSWHLREEAVQRLLWIGADDRVRRPRHAEIGDVGGAVRKQAFVGSLHVAMRAHDRAGAPVEVPAHGLG